MSKNVIRCLNCNKIVHQKKVDSFGRRNSKVAQFCRSKNNKCYEEYLAKNGKKQEYNKNHYDRRKDELRKNSL